MLSAFASPWKGKQLPGKYPQNIYVLIVSTLHPKLIHVWFIPSCTWANTSSSFASWCSYWQWYVQNRPWLLCITLFEHFWPILEWRDSIYLLLIFLCTSSSFSLSFLGMGDLKFMWYCSESPCCELWSNIEISLLLLQIPYPIYGTNTFAFCRSAPPQRLGVGCTMCISLHMG